MTHDKEGKDMKKTLKDIIYIVAEALAKAVNAISEQIDISAPLMKTVAPYSRQSFSENVRNNNSRQDSPSD